MKTIVKYTHFFAYTETSNKYFYVKFEDGVNIIYGKNTSGKSTLIQSINYTFGINDERHKLGEILKENIIFRLDFEIQKKDIERLTIIRDTDFIYIRRKGLPVLKFSGISSNNSEEHIQLKQYLATLFGFDLFLESKNEYKLGSIETIFLPYYVSQDYGWVLILKSFRGLEYFKNFKADYYDYYLGINNEYNRTEKQQLENEKKELENELKFLKNTERKSDRIQLSKLKDEAFIVKSAEYLDTYKITKAALIEKEKLYLTLSNQIRLFEERINILNKVKRSISQQEPSVNNCPTCNQSLPTSLKEIYEYYQDVNDTKEQLFKIRKEIKEKTGILNSTIKDIEELRKIISKEYSILKDYQIEDLSVHAWIENKANIEMSNNILKRIGEINISLESIDKKLSKYKTDNDIKEERKNKDVLFKRYFYDNLRKLEVNDFNEDYSLYKIGLFPQQGVELLKALLAYYFAFNKIIKDTVYIHRLPLVLDAIFKEDVDDQNKELILQFISSNRPIDTQTIFSIAESTKNTQTAENYNKNFFNNKANLILINKEEKRAFLKDYVNTYDALKDDTLKLME